MKLMNINRLSVIVVSAALLAVILAIGLYALPRSGSEPDASASIGHDSFSQGEPKIPQMHEIEAVESPDPFSSFALTATPTSTPCAKGHGDCENHPAAQSAGWSLGQITVNGSATIEAETDIGNILLGVSVLAPTVKEARSEAAAAMNSVLSAVKAKGVKDDDISTTRFRIYPETLWVEEKIELKDGAIANKGRSMVVGHNVENSVHMIVRDVDKIGDVLDAAAEAGGDNIRIESIYFSVDNASDLMVHVHQAAALDARQKAELYAATLGVILGPLTELQEGYSSAPLAMVERSARAAADAYPLYQASPINPGEEDFSASITASFAILGPARNNAE